MCESVKIRKIYPHTILPTSSAKNLQKKHYSYFSSLLPYLLVGMGGILLIPYKRTLSEIHVMKIYWQSILYLQKQPITSKMIQQIQILLWLPLMKFDTLPLESIVALQCPHSFRARYFLTLGLLLGRTLFLILPFKMINGYVQKPSTIMAIQQLTTIGFQM